MVDLKFHSPTEQNAGVAHSHEVAGAKEDTHRKSLASQSMMSPTFNATEGHGPDSIGTAINKEPQSVALVAGQPSSVAGSAVGFQCVPPHRPLADIISGGPKPIQKAPWTLSSPATNFSDARKAIHVTRETIQDARKQEMAEVRHGVATLTAPGIRNVLVAGAWTMDKAGFHNKANAMRAEADRLTSRIATDGGRSPLSDFASAARQEFKNVGTGVMGLHRAGNLAGVGVIKKGAAGLAQDVSAVASGVAKSEDALAGLRHHVADAARSVGAEGIARFVDSRGEAARVAAASNRKIADKADRFAANINKGLVIQGPPDSPTDKR
jgi:hypothetical protein